MKSVLTYEETSSVPYQHNQRYNAKRIVKLKLPSYNTHRIEAQPHGSDCHTVQHCEGDNHGNLLFIKRSHNDR